MSVDAAILDTRLTCPSCSGPVDLKTPHVAVAGTEVRMYCSDDCLNGRGAPPEVIAPARPKRRAVWWIASGLAVGAPGVSLYMLRDRGAQSDPVAMPAPEPETIGARESGVDLRERERAEDAALVAELGRDVWLHPLAGPTRRMPANHNGAFGATRDGERPPECVSGHCGVDLGREWGERVHAVHEGVVDFVNRGPNEEHGGLFVRIAHRGGTLYSWYFHLAAVPRNVRAGAKVTAGQVIGLLGDTGVVSSGPHLHFSLSVKPTKHARERYLDPEPLIAIWPLWNPNEGKLTTTEAPGLPVRAPSRRRDRKRPAQATPASAPAASPASPAASPATHADPIEPAPAVAPSVAPVEAPPT
jgi:murein DD-endopeptidase MepM/ murein hydrolase activator NlpD